MFSAAIVTKAQLIKVLILDVDGVLTDGKIIYDDQGHEIKSFHVHDGLGIKLLQEHGIKVAVISSRETTAVTKRLTELNIQYIFQGQKNKLISYEQLLRELNVADEQVAYMGDDLPDLPVLRRVGLSIAVANATTWVREYVHWTTKNNGGQGAVREVCENILQAQNLVPTLLKRYL